MTATIKSLRRGEITCRPATLDRAGLVVRVGTVATEPTEPAVVVAIMTREAWDAAWVVDSSGRVLASCRNV